MIKKITLDEDDVKNIIAKYFSEMENIPISPNFVDIDCENEYISYGGDEETISYIKVEVILPK